MSTIIEIVKKDKSLMRYVAAIREDDAAMACRELLCPGLGALLAPYERTDEAASNLLRQLRTLDASC